MADSVIEIEHLFKEYRLGLIGYGTLREDLQSWWARVRGKEDPNSILSNLNKSANGQITDHILALNDINLTVKRGERLGIIGPNGAGKTTLLKILARIASPTKGISKIKGRVASLIAVGTGFHPELTGRENIYLNGAILGLRKFEIDQRFEEIVEFSGVEQFIDTPVKRYSSGMGVRLGFSVAAHLDPDVLIVDEVLAVGDAEFRDKAIGKMRGVSEKQSRTIMFVSHDMAAIKNLCSRVVLINKGEIVKNGDPRKVVDFYLKSNQPQNKPKVSSVNLNSLENREGNQLIRLNWIQTTDENNVPKTDFFVGDDIKIVCGFSTKYETLARDVSLVIEIVTHDGIPLCHLSSNYQKNFTVLLDNTMYVSVLLQDVRFVHGEYFINVKLRNFASEVYDYLENCLAFNMVIGGELVHNKLGRESSLIHLTPSWHNENENMLIIDDNDSL